MRSHPNSRPSGALCNLTKLVVELENGNQGLEADQDLPPEIKERDLLLVDRSAGKRLPRGEGLYVFSVPTGLAVRRLQVGLKRGFVVTGSGISEELDVMEIDRLLVGRVIWRGGRT